MTDLPTGALVIRVGADGRPVYYGKWRLAGRQRLRRIGPAWLRSSDGVWVPRSGHPRTGHLDEKRATVRMAEMVAEDVSARDSEIDAERTRRERLVTFRELAHDWLDWQEHVKGTRPSSLRDIRSILAEPGAAHRRGRRACRGRIMAALGSRPAAEVTTREVGKLLRSFDDDNLSPRTVNKHRGVMVAIYNYAMREDTFGLLRNPAAGTDKRREPPAAALDFYEPDDIELLARAAAAGEHRIAVDGLGQDEIEARCSEDAQDAELFRILAFTGMRLGEAMALRWSDVDLSHRRLIVQRARSAGVEGPTKGWQVRYVPLADPARDAFIRLQARGDFTRRDDYVFCGRFGKALDDSALRRRYRRAVQAAGLRYVKLHGLRHGAGSLVAREMDAVFVQHFLGHAKLATTERYMHAKARHEDVARLNRAFGAVPTESAAS